jgi:hypothetical protein
MSTTPVARITWEAAMLSPFSRATNSPSGWRLSEAGMVVRARNPGGAALARVDQHETAAEAREIDRRREAARAAADDEAVERLAIGRGSVRHAVGPWPSG